jgi:hypothetical protein
MNPVLFQFERRTYCYDPETLHKFTVYEDHGWKPVKDAARIEKLTRHISEEQESGGD